MNRGLHPPSEWLKGDNFYFCHLLGLSTTLYNYSCWIKKGHKTSWLDLHFNSRTATFPTCFSGKIEAWAECICRSKLSHGPVFRESQISNHDCFNCRCFKTCLTWVVYSVLLNRWFSYVILATASWKFTDGRALCRTEIIGLNAVRDWERTSRKHHIHSLFLLWEWTKADIWKRERPLGTLAQPVSFMTGLHISHISS